VKDFNYLNSLNFFRSVSGFGVCISHYFFYMNNIIFFEFLSFLFVEFFFILSGYVLTPQLLKINTKENLKIFWYRRWIRTLPLFILCLITFSFLFKRFDEDTVKYFFLIQNIYPNFLNTDYISVLWSLSIEEYFYILFPLLLFFFKKINILKISLILIVFYFFLNFLSSFYLQTSELRTNTFLRLDSIAYGIVLFFVIKRNIKINNKFVFTTLSFLLVYFFINFSNKDFNNLETFLYILSLKFFSFCLCFTIIKKENLFLNFSKLGKILANLVYSAYLFHLLFIYLLKFYSLNVYISFVIYIGLLLLFTLCIYNFFEKPLNNLRPKYVK
jgi:peptidoglycan/LPS O-acetylase OafA/YrhL